MFASNTYVRLRARTILTVRLYLALMLELVLFALNAFVTVTNFTFTMKGYCVQNVPVSSFPLSFLAFFCVTL